MKNLEQKKLSTVLLIFGCITLFLATLSGYFVFELLSLKQTASELYKENVALLEKESNIQALKQFVEETTQEQEALGSYFIEDKSEVTALLLELETLAVSHNVSLNTTIATEKKKSPNGGDNEQVLLVLKLETRGTFKNVYAFMALLENLHLKLSFDGLYLRRISDTTLKKGEAPEWSGSFSILVLSYEE